MSLSSRKGLGIKTVWTKEMDDNLLKLISERKNAVSIEISMKLGQDTIRKRIREMGFDGLIDARRVMCDEGE